MKRNLTERCCCKGVRHTDSGARRGAKAPRRAPSLAAIDCCCCLLAAAAGLRQDFSKLGVFGSVCALFGSVWECFGRSSGCAGKTTPVTMEPGCISSVLRLSSNSAAKLSDIFFILPWYVLYKFLKLFLILLEELDQRNSLQWNHLLESREILTFG